MTAAELVAFVEHLARLSADGSGPQGMAEYLARSAQVGVLLEDAQWRQLAASGSGLPRTARPLLREDAAEGTFFELDGGRAGRTLAVMSGSDRVGQLSVFGSGDLSVAEHAVRVTAAAIAVQLARASPPAAGGRSTFWQRLASGAYTDVSAAREDAAAGGTTLVSAYCAVALEADEDDQAAARFERGAVRAAAHDAFARSEGETGAFEQNATMLFVLPAHREIDRANARTAATLFARRATKTFAGLRVYGGIGSPVSPTMLALSVAQAKTALTITRRFHEAGRVSAYDDLGIYPLLLQGASASDFELFARRILAPLRTYDENHQTELERTLRLYFDAGENVKTAAEQLCVHRHTVFYRLRQIGEICRCKLDDPHDQLTLRTALAIDAITR